MKERSDIIKLIFRIITVVLFIGFLAAQSSCASSKKGMVPCPCEKKHNRR